MKKLNLISLFVLVGACSTELIYPILGTWRRAGRREAAAGQDGKDAAYKAGFNDGSKNKAPKKPFNSDMNDDFSDEELQYFNNPTYNAPRYNVLVDDESGVSTQATSGVKVQALGDEQSNNSNNDPQDAMKAKIEARFKEKQEAHGSNGVPNANQQAKMKARMEKRFEQKMENRRNKENGNADNPSSPDNAGHAMQPGQSKNAMRAEFMKRMKDRSANTQPGNGAPSA